MTELVGDRQGELFDVGNPAGIEIDERHVSVAIGANPARPGAVGRPYRSVRRGGAIAGDFPTNREPRRIERRSACPRRHAWPGKPLPGAVLRLHDPRPARPKHMQ